MRGPKGLSDRSIVRPCGLLGIGMGLDFALAIKSASTLCASAASTSAVDAAAAAASNS